MMCRQRNDQGQFCSRLSFHEELSGAFLFFVLWYLDYLLQCQVSLLRLVELNTAFNARFHKGLYFGAPKTDSRANTSRAADAWAKEIWCSWGEYLRKYFNIGHVNFNNLRFSRNVRIHYLRSSNNSRIHYSEIFFLEPIFVMKVHYRTHPLEQQKNVPKFHMVSSAMH